MKRLRKIKHPCSVPNCMGVGAIRIEAGHWLCLPHTQERIDLLHAKERAQVDEDLREQDGEPS